MRVLGNRSLYFSHRIIRPSNVSFASTAHLLNNYLNEQYSIQSTKAQNSKFVSKPSARIKTKINTETRSLLSSINRCNDIQSVFNAINDPSATHISVYAKSLQKCHELSLLHPDSHHNHQYIKTLFLMVEKRRIPINIYFFNILLNVLSKIKIQRSDLLFYFQQMISHKEVSSECTPNSITLSVLLKCCRKCNDLKLAEKILILLRDVELDKFGLNELIGIYGNHRNIETAKMYFDKLCAVESTPNIIAYGSMLNAFAECGDIQSIKAMIERMKCDDVLRPQLQRSPVVYNSLMKGYANCNPPRPDKMLSVFKVMAYSTECKVMDIHIHFKATAYNALIEQCIQREDVEGAIKYLDKLMNEVPEDRLKLVSSKSKYSQQLACSQLKGCIKAFQRNFELVVPIFEKRLKVHIGYWGKMESGQIVLDFHGFFEIVTRFILQYVFRYQKLLVKEALDDNGTLRVLCEDVVNEKYAAKDSNDKVTERKTLKDVITDEILSADPSATVDIDDQNECCLLVTFSADFFD